ncbi:NRDE family protein [Flavobacteriaceae bacterium GSB9]|nr:NRDE family protein [Flavobacteriaceae bacterium GSB9]
MCTVTIFPLENNDFVLTTNRDEAPDRNSLAPSFYTFQGAKLLFPKDEQSGGTWVGVSEKKRVVCVLNGGFEYHERQLEKGKSRGLIAKDILAAENAFETTAIYDLENVEPFTMVIADWNTGLKFIEWVWDGKKKYFRDLPMEIKMWSSSTLYSPKMKAERLQWFEEFKKNNALSADTLIAFHKTAGNGNNDYGVIMDRGFVKTTSITQVVKQKKKVEMAYKNLQNNKASKVLFKLPETVNE